MTIVLILGIGLCGVLSLVDRERPWSGVGLLITAAYLWMAAT